MKIEYTYASSSSSIPSYLSKFDVTYNHLMDYARDLALKGTTAKVDGKTLEAELGHDGGVNLYVYADRADITLRRVTRELVLHFHERHFPVTQVAVYKDMSYTGWPDVYDGGKKLMDDNYTIFKSFLAAAVQRWFNDRRYEMKRSERTSLW